MGPEPASKSSGAGYASPMPGTGADHCWILTDGAAGNERQALALAAALGLAPRTIRLQLRRPLDWLAPRGVLAAGWGVRGPAGQALQPPWPALAIGCGRRAALALRALRRWSGGRSFTVQILDPRIRSACLDLVIAPHHDRLRGANVIGLTGSLNPVDDRWLAAGREAFAAFADLPAPRVAVLVGGPTRAQPLDTAWAGRLLDALAAWQARHGGSILASVSRRTPERLRDQLEAGLAAWPGMFHAGEGTNPYAGLLGWADRIMVSPDSVNMLSEACATGRPVHTLTAAPLRGKLGRFHQDLADRGLLLPLGDDLPAGAAPLRETARVAHEVGHAWRRQARQRGTFGG